VKQPLLTPASAERAALRDWLAVDADHAALAVCHNFYSLKDALHFLITCGLYQAERAGMSEEMGRTVAVSLFWDVLGQHEARLTKVRWEIVEAAKLSLKNDPDDFQAAGKAAAAVARANHAPPGMIEFGLRMAMRAA
jgi:hypothetical protein